LDSELCQGLRYATTTTNKKLPELQQPKEKRQTGSEHSNSDQGCQMVCFQTKNTNLGKFWRVLQWKMLEYFIAIWSIFYRHLVYFVAIWYVLWPFGIFYGYLVYFPPFWYVVPRKIWQP
jgi:hypothetical protein